MPKSNFLCTSCLHLMCDDCKSIAEEYHELLVLRNRALVQAERKIEELTSHLAQVQRIAAEWKHTAELFTRTRP